MTRRVLETREVEGEQEGREFQEADWEIASVAPGTKAAGTAYFVHLMARYF
nr:hypothetical protein [uncultured Pseudomonas sp.]